MGSKIDIDSLNESELIDLNNRVIEQVRRFALSLPEASEEPHHELSSFRVRGKVFATVPPDGEHLHIFVDEQQREPVVALKPATFQKLWWGAKVVGLRVVLSTARPTMVNELVYSAWCRKAPKRLVTSHSRFLKRPRGAPVT